MPIATIHSLDNEGRGITRSAEGKAVFVEGALPGEEVDYTVVRKKKTYEQAQIRQIVRASAQRVTPRCAFFEKCGGCSMQHLDSNAQAAVKQRVLENALWHIARLKPGIIYPAIVGAPWGYRYRARIGVRYVPSKGGVLVGFHEKRSSYIADMTSCQILPPHISDMLLPLRELIDGLSVRERLPQIEIAIGDTETVLVFRNLVDVEPADIARLRSFAETHAIQVWLQPSGPASAYRVHPESAPALTYSMPEFGVTMTFRPNDFTQVNVPINRVLMRRSMHLLDPQPGERIADLFCGLGNFSLPIARSGATVIGVEGSDALVARAAENARANGLAERTEFYAANLFEATEDSIAALGKLDKLLIDPPRDGAMAVVRALGPDAPRRIVYVSCNPASLARDAAVLVYEKGYWLKGAGIANMFPQTSHVESIALFERD
ncbi:23S rRNA (uracil(1939)-C(5))-methyltransferase RlmD [Denitromonas sp.]|uniref:23S rRNA (uracil(1939)-C(5))-methyltransferase RlmD n=1 Tax=Denitromonas sp. TaxID=2734609 RepID=UPI003A89E2B2